MAVVHINNIILYMQLSGRVTPLHCRPTSKKDGFHAIDLSVIHLSALVHTLTVPTGIVAKEKYFKFTSQGLEKYAVETLLDYTTHYSMGIG